MSNRLKVVLFSEINSKLGSPFLRVLSAHPLIKLIAVVTSPENVLCSYFVNDDTKVDIEIEAKALGIKVLRPVRVSAPGVADELEKLEPDYLIVANFQQLLSPELLAVPRIAAINFHPSPLPRYAGLAPFFWMVRNGESQSAISVIKMDEGLDTGPIIMQRQISLTNQETTISLRTFQEKQNVLMLLDLIPSLANGAFTCVPQDLSKRTYYGRPQEQDYLLDFNLDAKTLQRHIRAGYRHPGAHFFLPDGTKVVVLSAIVPHGVDIGVPNFPGCIVQTATGIFIATADEWLQLLTVEVNGVESPVVPNTIPAIFRLARQMTTKDEIAFNTQDQMACVTDF
ncbi:methionyl-tRNA formyltransferase [Photorhabdus sp. CRCIA-P01]|uniref:methionyl-tRNA formyltransferase n=1 Tax=Photorhabdus sp. CRCIA-P01 TaxID=2019570 RepID=UPI000E59F520|nr:formyltransferase family protein [Photorhabdus sp. CRCIA-P01]